MSWEIWKDKYAVQFPRNVRNDSYTTWTFTDVPAQLTSSRYHAIPRVTCFLWVESAQCSSKFPRQILLHVLTLSNVTRLKFIYNKIYLKKSIKTIMPFQWWNSDWIISRRSIFVIPTTKIFFMVCHALNAENSLTSTVTQVQILRS